MDRKANENQEAVKAPVDGKIDGKSVLLQRGDTSLNIRNFAKTGTLHIKKTWENPNDALTEKTGENQIVSEWNFYRTGILAE